MKQFEFVVKSPQGLHARPAGLLVKSAAGFAAAITLEKDGKEADGKKIFGVMGLGARQGDTLVIKADGSDEGDAIAFLEQFMNENF